LDPANPHALAQTWVFDPATGLPTTLTSTTGTGAGTTTALAHVPGTHQLATATSTGPGAASRTFTWQPDGTPATWTGPDGTTWTATSSTTGATTTLTAGGGPGAGARVDRAVAPDGTILAEHTTTPAGTSLLIDLGPIGRITITTSPDSQETVTGQRDQRRPDGTLATTRTGPALTDTTAFHTDTQGTPIAAAGTTMLDGTAPTGRRWWTAYGGPRGPPDTTSGPAATGWLGRPQHPTAQAATGLTRLGARDHDPTLGTFTTPDPITAFGDPGSLDPYTYARWNPITSSDPSGLWPDWGKAKNTLAKAGAWAWKHKAAIAGAAAGLVVGAAACALTAGLGCVLIGGAIAGAAASATTYSIEAATGQRTWNTRDFLTTTATGAILGAAAGAEDASPPPPPAPPPPRSRAPPPPWPAQAPPPPKPSPKPAKPHPASQPPSPTQRPPPAPQHRRQPAAAIGSSGLGARQPRRPPWITQRPMAQRPWR
jgi:RHS repeat-associated protein